MRKIFLILCFLILVGIAQSALIEVGVVEQLKGNISSINYDNSSNLVKFSIEFYNTGSVPYKARIKTEIFNNSNLVFNGWTQEKEFMTGDKKTLDIYWYGNYTGEYSVKLRTYFGNEIKDYRKFKISVNKIAESESIFEIKNFRTYDNYVIFDVKSNETVKNVIIIPDNYVSGWIFEQKRLDNITKDRTKTIVLPYKPSLWIPTNVTLKVISNNGKYYTERTIEMKKNEGLIGLFYNVIDFFRLVFFAV